MSTLTADWPDLCVKGCGNCCRYKAELPGGLTVYTPFHCTQLDRATRQCKVYATKHEGRVCLTARQALGASLLPNECPYVQCYGPAGYSGPVLLPWSWWAAHREWLQALALRFGVGPRELAEVVADCEAGRW